MSSKAIYHIVEAEHESWLLAAYGANALSPLLRLTQAQEIASQMAEAPSIGHIFAHLSYEGKYLFPRSQEDEMFAAPIPSKDLQAYNRMFRRTMEIDMRITLDLPQNKCLLEFNHNAPSFRLMDDYTISIDVGQQNVATLCKTAEEKGITDFGRLCNMYYQATGLSAALENARGNYEVEQLYTSEARNAASDRLAQIESDEDLEV